MATRPRLHFTADSGWINDPLGLTWHGGAYHLFFQYRRAATQWGADCHWGHATSPDLFWWTEGPVALRPGDGDDGCWSGSLVVPPGRDAVLFYTSARLPDDHLGRVRRALPADPLWEAWVKKEVLVTPPPDADLIGFRDPFVFADGPAWRMLVGAGRVDGHATAYAYRSDDLIEWVPTGQLVSRSREESDATWTGGMWECVQLVEVDGAHLLVVSVWDRADLHHVACATGRYADGHYDVESWFRLTYGPAPYAASAYRDRDGRPGLIAWLRGVADPTGSWTGAHSVPMLLSLDGDRPRLNAHPGLAARRGPAGPPAWGSGGPVELAWSPRDGEALEVMGGEATLVAGGVALALTTDAGSWAMPWAGDDVVVLLDGPVLEVFCGGALMAAPIAPGHTGARPAGRCEAHPLRT
ncbi:MAG TPA: glycoside hydrolase family 32 protein [Asanoa sp.]